MAGDTILTLVGNLTADPELRFTPNGAAVANFTVASTPRTFDKNSNAWKDGDTLFMRCAVWREAAENAANSLTKGTAVIVTGRLKSRSYDTSAGEKRTVIEMDVDDIGASLRWATVKITKAGRSGGGTQAAGNTPDPWATGGATRSGPGAAAQTDPWSTEAKAASVATKPAWDADEPPF